MSTEQVREGGEEHNGEWYLNLLELGDLADTDIPVQGKVIKGRDFLDICGEHAVPMLEGFNAMDQDDPKREPTLLALQNVIRGYIEPASPPSS